MHRILCTQLTEILHQPDVECVLQITNNHGKSASACLCGQLLNLSSLEHSDSRWQCPSARLQPISWSPLCLFVPYVEDEPDSKSTRSPGSESYVSSDNACCSTDSMISVITVYTINTGTDFALGDLLRRLTMACRPVDRVNQGFQ